MKRTIICMVLLLAVLATNAQTQPARKLAVTENSVVRDSAGVQYPFMLWQKVMASGDYWIKPVDSRKEDTEFVLVKYTEQQKYERISHYAKPKESTFFTTGQTIKPFKIRDINGKKIEAKDWAGKTIVLNFWFIGCPPCRAEIPDLNKLAIKYKNDPNVIFIGIALDDDYDVQQFTKANPFSYTLVGNGKYLASSFNINLYPTNAVIDKAGKVRLHYVSNWVNGPYWIDKTIQESEKGDVKN